MVYQEAEGDDPYLIALSLVKDVGPLTAKRLLAHFKTPKEIFRASFEELSNCKDVGHKRASSIKEFDDWARVEGYLKRIKDLGVQLLRYTDSDYPQSLREIDDSPILFYCKGTLLKEDSLAMAVVGSRHMSEYGSKVAFRIGSALAAAGITVVSGFARGIDTQAHLGAIHAKGRTIAVLGSGIDIIYPHENRALYDRISASGCLISEFPLGYPPDKRHFPQRNRLISGLSMGVLVVEAALNSGSLITAQYALDQNKEVYAVPGNITSGSSQGTNALIKRGAKLVQRAEDIIEDLLPQLKVFLSNKPSENTALEINEKEKAIFSLMHDESVHIDRLVRGSGLNTEEVLAALLNLELKGLVRQIEGKRFIKS